MEKTAFFSFTIPHSYNYLAPQTNVALDVLKKDEVSAALFAPGGIYETKQPPDFQTAQNR